MLKNKLLFLIFSIIFYSCEKHEIEKRDNYSRIIMDQNILNLNFATLFDSLIYKSQSTAIYNKDSMRYIIIIQNVYDTLKIVFTTQSPFIDISPNIILLYNGYKLGIFTGLEKILLKDSTFIKENERAKYSRPTRQAWTIEYINNLIKVIPGEYFYYPKARTIHFTAPQKRKNNSK